jgi:hypothetical protein
MQQGARKSDIEKAQDNISNKGTKSNKSMNQNIGKSSG